MRPSGRDLDQLRSVEIRRSYLKGCDGSVLISCGDTRVLCAATVEEKVPPFLKGTGKGWITAEYGMMPRSSPQRIEREVPRGRQGRTHEIMRLIGRSLRSVLDPKALGERQIIVDCDVIQADGGTRCAAITGAYIAVVDALAPLRKRGVLGASWPLREAVAAVSVGLFGGEARLDLDYLEDSAADVDMNVVGTASGLLVELGATAERAAFDRVRLAALLTLAEKGLKGLFEAQTRALAGD
ncbi:MAG: ribonuclease PH [bacterium]